MIVDAIESVLAQNYPHVEHIIVDGVSTDGTLELLKRYPHLKVQVGHDKGMYDALNKGLKLAHGEIVGFLNTDDLYAPGIFKEVAAHFANATVDAVAGNARIFRKNDDGNPETIMEITPSTSDYLLEQIILGIPAFNAWFFRRSVFERIGTFDTGYRIIADREFMIRLALVGIVYARTDHLVYQYRQHAGSLTISGNDTYSSKIAEEHLKMTDCFLRKAGMPEKAKQYLRKMRTRDTLNMAISHLYKREFGRAWFYAREGIWSDWGWLLKLASWAFHRLTHSVLGKISNA